MAEAFINGQAYSNVQILFFIGNTPFVSVTDITVTESAVRTLNRGTSRRPISYGEGEDEDGAISFSIDLTDMRKLELSAQALGVEVKRLAPFNIVITHLNESKPYRQTVVGTLIQSVDKGSEVGNTNNMATISGIFSHLEFKYV